MPRSAENYMAYEELINESCVYTLLLQRLIFKKMIP